MNIEQVQISHEIALPVLRTAEHSCPYLPQRRATEQVALVAPIMGNRSNDVQMLLDHQFRRSGTIYYRPSCDECQACTPIRIPIERFVPTRSQRRVRRRNDDVSVHIKSPATSDEAFDLYKEYEHAVHVDTMIESRDAFDDFFGPHPLIQSWHFEYRIDGRLIGLGLVDQADACLSSVYFYYDPAERQRSLGVYSALCEIDACRERGLPYWYLGYFVDGCRKMSYKTRFTPYELQQPDGTWISSIPRDSMSSVRRIP